MAFLGLKILATMIAMKEHVGTSAEMALEAQNYTKLEWQTSG